MTAIPLLDLHALYDSQRDAIDQAIRRVVESQHFILGPEVQALEREIETFLEAPVHAVGCGSGSDALVLALRALEVGPGDQVITTVHSFTSTATSVDLVGATPIFVDVEPDSLNLDPQQLTQALTPHTRAVIAVHLFGRPADIPAIRQLLDSAGRQDVAIIEDAAQALGARLDGQRICTLGDFGTISFFPSKNLGGFGDGGMVVVRDPAHAEVIRQLRAHGAARKYEAVRIGQNSRLDGLQAAVLRVRLPMLDTWCELRRQNAARYRTLLGEHLPAGTLPADDGPDGRFYHIYNQFNLRLPERDQVAQALQDAEIGSAIYYPRTLAQQPCYAGRGFATDGWPNASQATRDSLAIPIGPTLDVESQERVAQVIVGALAGTRAQT